VAKARFCANCGSPDVKVYPDEFASSRWPFTVVSTSVRMAGGPDPSRRILVCTSCGHNEDVSLADL
jgi:hypothetical protein